MKNNLFIALEGIDGSGKSSQVLLLAEKLHNAGHKVYTTYEPTDGMVGSLLRSILKGSTKADHRTIAGLFLADRLDHLLNEETGLVKKMQEGYTVITDRYYFSSYAYHATHMDMNWVIAANSLCAQALRPDINIYIDVPPDVCMQRINVNRKTTELFETLETLKKVQANYFAAFELLKGEEQVVLIDGNNTIKTISEQIWNEVRALLQ